MNVSKRRTDQVKMSNEYEEFLRDRFNISLYCNKDYQPSEVASMTDGEDVPCVPLEELSDEEEGDDSMRE